MSRTWITAAVFAVSIALPGGVLAQSDSLPEPDWEEGSDEAKSNEDRKPPPRPGASESSNDGTSEEGKPEAGESKRTSECIYHDDCPARQLCHGGRCVKRSKFTEYTSANDECGNDRRCRIERLERRNRARRQTELIRQERQLQELIDEYQAKRIEEYPRLDRAFSADLRASRLGVLGLSVGYTFLGRLRPELHLAYNGGYSVSQNIDDQRFSGTQEVGYVIPGLLYFFLTSDFTPYAGLSFLYGTGTYNGFNGPATDTSLETEYHALSVKAGIDYQLNGSGFHARAGLAYRHLIYSQARRSPGLYVEQTREALEQWFNDITRIDILVLVGWAF